MLVIMNKSSWRVNDGQVTISYYKANEETPMAMAVLQLTCVEISLDVDSRRSGVVAKKAENKKEWTWGPEGKGAVLLVNCDRDRPQTKGLDCQDEKVGSKEDLKDMSVMILTTRGPADIFKKHQLVLHVSASENDKVRVFHAQEGREVSQYRAVLGPRRASYKIKSGRHQEAVFYVEGLAFPDVDFSGLVSFHVTLLENLSEKFPATPIFSDSVVFRVAPWIMTPNTLPPKKVYVCSISDSEEFVDEVMDLAQSRGYDSLVEAMEELHRKSEDAGVVADVCRMVRKTNNRDFVVAVSKLARDSKNTDFVDAVKELAVKAGCSLVVCKWEKNHGDRWIQDEMEIGYVQAPHKEFPVVFDSPRNRELKDYPFKDVLGPDFGYVTREPATDEIASQLDSFGNLEVSPPVTVRGKQYPLGRILIGSYISREENREMFKIVRDFLYAQKVQSPVELDSDWLVVGHVDEFLTFVPAPDRQGFRLLLASPTACYKLLKAKEEEGHGEALMFEGKLDICHQVKIKSILADEDLKSSNEYFQKCIDWNRDILKAELGLAEEDIIDIPQLFTTDEDSGKAAAYFPDMVNMLVLGKHLGIPKPFGPVVNRACCLEEEVRRLLEPLGLLCTFIDDYKAYHQKHGEVHCGTNVCRQPFSFKWWNMATP
ncbi:protein-arginine deiminase type-4-like [Sphaerodactylus townsendi]|uniref:protein-arginine deiminase type-4-like n=1 Tax=Sphaerodactylus townsendi TaxID=933632 RepID=UPI0020265A2F|nr:protein-arginine deiminase type-4-like [Sphaerodactylus townsendi]